MNLIELIQNILCGNRKCPDTDYLTERIETLSEELAQSIGPIDLIEEHQQEIYPHYIINDKYDLVTADAEYLTYTTKDWATIIHRLHQHFIGKFKYTTHIADCDDFALLHASTIAYSAYHAGLSKQPAFAIAWSTTHAFNLIIDSNNISWIIEPQNGTVIGRLGNDLGENYDVKKIWFLS